MDLATMPWLAQGGVIGGVVAMALGTVFYAVRMVYTGRLVPKSTVDELKAAAEKRIAAAEKQTTDKAAEVAEYKAAWLASEKTRHEQDAQISELMESSRTTITILRSIAPITPHGEAPDVVAP